MEKNPHPRVAVIVLGYNHKDTIKACLDSVLLQTRTPELLRYIDNASTDGSADFVREHFPSMDIQINAFNNGYAGAYQQSLSEVFKQDFNAIILLNPDMIVDERWLETLVDNAFQDNSVAIAQSKIYLYNAFAKTKTNRINTVGNHVHFLGFGYCGNYNQIDTQHTAKNHYITAASGAGMLIKKTAYRKILGLDASFFAYLEDQDINWQVHLQGYNVLLVATSIAWHQYDFHKKHLNNLKFYLIERNRLTFLLKHFETKTLVIIAPAFLIMECGMLFDALVRGYFKSKLQSYRDFARCIPDTFTKRKILQSTRIRSDHDLFPLLVSTIEFEAIQSLPLSIANIFLRLYYHIIKYFI